MRHAAFAKAAVPLISLILAAINATTPSVAAGNPPEPTGPPRQGTLDWAFAVERAWQDVKHASRPAESAPAYQRLLELYADCRGCRIHLANHLEFEWRQRSGPRRRLEQFVVAALADEPARLGRFLIEAGRPDEAKEVIQRSLGQASSVDQRLELLQILAQSEEKLGRTAAVRRLARRLLRETPASRFYCEQALPWWVWKGEEPGPDPSNGFPMGVEATFAQLRDLERAQGNTPYVSCLYNRHLANLDRILRYYREPGREMPAGMESLFPWGIEGAQVELARRTRDPTVRAAILLDAAARLWTRSQSQTRALVAEALRDGPRGRTRVGALSSELGTIWIHDQTEEVKRLALKLIDGYPEYDASCDGCVTYWQALTYRWPENSDPIREWGQKCGKRMARCDAQTWFHFSYTTPPDHEHAIEVYEALLGMNPPAEIVPGVLLLLSAAVTPTDPTRGWELAWQGIRHPEYPGWRGRYQYPQLPLPDAEIAGDFEAALFHWLLSRPGSSQIASCIAGERSGEIESRFIRAYYEVRLGIRARERWTELMGLLPTNPEDPSMDGLELPYFFERFVAAAKVMNEEGAVLDWFRALRQQYRDVLGRAAIGERPGREHRKLVAEESLIGEYVERLEGRYVPANGPTPETPGLAHESRNP